MLHWAGAVCALHTSDLAAWESFRVLGCLAGASGGGFVGAHAGTPWAGTFARWRTPPAFCCDGSTLCRAPHSRSRRSSECDVAMAQRRLERFWFSFPDAARRVVRASAAAKRDVRQCPRSGEAEALGVRRVARATGHNRDGAGATSFRRRRSTAGHGRARAPRQAVMDSGGASCHSGSATDSSAWAPSRGGLGHRGGGGGGRARQGPHRAVPQR
mmetsp:Transcript_115711/g.327214  ORF Transcript_115711/g.327214 Transcript_115711/m.327214 type:complete len:214 (-) Transcript_115711:838-1479(-)